MPGVNTSCNNPRNIQCAAHSMECSSSAHCQVSERQRTDALAVEWRRREAEQAAAAAVATSTIAALEARARKVRDARCIVAPQIR